MDKIDQNTIDTAVKEFIESGGKIKKITEQDVKNSEVKLIGHYNSKKSRGKVGGKFKTFI